MTLIKLTSSDDVRLVVEGHELLFSPADAQQLIGDRMVAWAAREGLDAHLIPASDFAITRPLDGQRDELWCHYRLITKDSAGHSVRDDEQRLVRTGWHTRRVTSLPTDY